ncbi:MAG: hypothetical protein EXS35_16440 [Pedosphaera sp.]|nr:hypothetical protein [Pedosphaera sp.]
MSEFKFACPVCGQHITCDSATSGTQMECPTCFGKLVVPQPPVAASSHLVLTAARVSNRPAPTVATDALTPAAKSFPVAAVMIVVVLCAAAGAAVVFRDKLFKPSRPHVAAVTNSEPAQTREMNLPVVTRPAEDTNWTLSLAEVKIPEGRATGWINGRHFAFDRATVQGGTLSFRQGKNWPPEVGVTIQLVARQGEDLAGKTVNIETNRDHPPRVTLRWKEAEQPRNQMVREGYALRLEFGAVAGNRLPGKIYLCTPDDAKSWVAGTFEAEIKKPAPPKPPKAPKVPAPTTPKR